MNIQYCNKCGNKFDHKGKLYEICDECAGNRYCKQCGELLDENYVCCRETKNNMQKSKIYFMLYIFFSIICIYFSIKNLLNFI